MTWTTNPIEADERGPRYAVRGTIRPNEFDVEFADTASQAEAIAERMRESHRRQVRILLPLDTNLESIIRDYRRARDHLNRMTDLARAVAHRLTEMGISESEAARQLDVDRMTIRSWLGKR